MENEVAIENTVQDTLAIITLPVGFTSTGLALPDELTESGWQEIGRQLAVTEAIQWALGDWYAYGKRKWGTKTAKRLAAETGYSEKTVYAYADVAEQIEFSRRVENLTFSHHRVVILANLEPEEQDYYLKTAAERGDSVADLEQRIKNDREAGTQPSAAEQAATGSTEKSEAELTQNERDERRAVRVLSRISKVLSLTLPAPSSLSESSRASFAAQIQEAGEQLIKIGKEYADWVPFDSATMPDAPADEMPEAERQQIIEAAAEYAALPPAQDEPEAELVEVGQ